MKTRKNARALLLLPGAFCPAGGLEMYDRLIIKGVQEVMREREGVCETLVLLDKDEHIDARYIDPDQPRPLTFAASRPRFAAGAVARALAHRPDLIVFGHVNFSSLGLALRAVRPSAQQWYLVYGIDVWHRISAPQRAATRTAEKILSISDYTRSELVRHNGVDRAKVGLLPCALDPFWSADFMRLAEGAPLTSLQRPLLLTVARLAETERYKGVDQVIRALPIIARDIPDVRYAVVGTGGDRPRLEALARELGVADRVEFRGRVSAEALAHAYAECALFVMPSAKEGFGIVFLEAALFGKPSIAGNHGGSPEVVEDGVTGRLVTYDDVPGFAKVATEMLGDPRRLRDMGQAALDRLNARFTYPIFLRTLRDHIREALDR
ncbi:MAG: glycosyltransferase family 4 protein [Byssovorax sp.]